MSAVSVPAPPAAAERVFGERLPLACEFAQLLCTEGVLRGVIGPREADRIWPRHLLNGAGLASLVPERARVMDVGSGAGLPGIPLALARPDLSMTLLEPLARRIAFLELVVAALGVPVAVVRGRAENLSGTNTDAVVVRAVAPLVRLVPLVMPLVRPGGLLLAVKGSSADEELAAAEAELVRAGVVSAEIVRIEVANAEQLTVIRCVAGEKPLRSRRTTRTPGR